MRRCPSLAEALQDIDAGTLTNATRIVVSRAWWDTLSRAERDTYQRRCVERRVELSTDDRISSHFVEIIGGGGEPPLSSEQRA